MDNFADLLGTSYPVIMGAMGSISNPELVAAVSEGGGYGLLATIGIDSDGLRRSIAAVRKLTDKPFGVNLVARNPLSPDLVGVLAEEGIGAVTTSAGSAETLTSLLHSEGIKVIHVVPSPTLALKAWGAGVDGIVAEGSESGGMQSLHPISTLSLVPQVVEAVPIPVAAAGGIYDGFGYAAAFAMGAAGVQIGTRLILTEECYVHTNYKEALLQAGLGDTTIAATSIGHVRALNNACLRSLEALPREERAGKVTEMALRFPSTCREEDMENTLVVTGECAGAIEDILPASDVVNKMVEDGEYILQNLR
jgi:enoyl-[acyl-carrier protein] reductase II